MYDRYSSDRARCASYQEAVEGEVQNYMDGCGIVAYLAFQLNLLIIL